MTLQEAYDEGFRLAKEYIDAENAALAARIAALEARSEAEKQLAESIKRQMERKR